MAIPLRIGTSGIIAIGPIFKATDGVTLATEYTTANVAISFIHMGATSTGAWATYAQTTAQAWTQVGRGMYALTVSSNPVALAGPWRVLIDATASGISLWEDYQVLPVKTFDGLLSSDALGAINVNAAYIGSTGASMTSGIMATSKTAFNVVAKYIGSTAATFASGVMSTSNSVIRALVRNWGSSGTTVASGCLATSLTAFNVVAKYVGSTAATFASGVMSTSASVLKVIDKYIGSSNTTFASGVMATSVNALRVMTNYWGSSGSTVTSGMMTSSKDAFMAAAKYWGTSTGMPISSGSMTSSKNAILAVDKFFGATNNSITTNIGTGDRTLGDLMTGMGAYLFGNATYDGATAAYYTSDGGTELFSYELTTEKRTVTTN